MNTVVIQGLGIEKKEVRRLFSEIVGKGNLELYDSPPESQDDLLQRVKKAHIIVTVDHPISREIISQCTELHHIAVSFTGTDHVDTGYAEERGIIVTNAAGYATRSVAELAIAQAINVLRGIGQQNRMMRKGGWKGTPGRTLNGKQACIVGGGRIGKMIAALLDPFGCMVKIISRNCSLSALAQSDIVFLALPLTDETRNMFDREVLSSMKPGTILINVARGPIVDEKAASESGIIYVPDVYDEEPLPENHRLRDNIFATPHIGYYTKEALHEKTVITMRNIAQSMNSM